MQKRHRFYFVGLIEPFQDFQKLEKYRRKLGIKHDVANVNGKIWAFMDVIVEYEVVVNEDRKITLKVRNQMQGVEIRVTLVYAKCTHGEKMALWER